MGNFIKNYFQMADYYDYYGYGDYYGEEEAEVCYDEYDEVVDCPCYDEYGDLTECPCYDEYGYQIDCPVEEVEAVEEEEKKSMMPMILYGTVVGLNWFQYLMYNGAWSGYADLQTTTALKTVWENSNAYGVIQLFLYVAILNTVLAIAAFAVKPVAKNLGFIAIANLAVEVVKFLQIGSAMDTQETNSSAEGSCIVTIWIDILALAGVTYIKLTDKEDEEEEVEECEEVCEEVCTAEYDEYGEETGEEVCEEVCTEVCPGDDGCYYDEYGVEVCPVVCEPEYDEYGEPTGEEICPEEEDEYADDYYGYDYYGYN